MPQILRTSRANRDLLEIGNYVAQDNADAADRLLKELGEKCELLATFPTMGRRRDELAPSLRSFPAGSYVIVYRPREDGIEVIRVLRGARDIEAAFMRGDPGV